MSLLPPESFVIRTVVCSLILGLIVKLITQSMFWGMFTVNMSLHVFWLRHILYGNPDV